MNVFEHIVPSELRFPRPPFRIDGGCVDAPANAISRYLDAIRSWRSHVIAFLNYAEGKCLEESHYLSPRAQRELATFLAESWTPGMSRYAAQSPYNIRAFPVEVLEGNGSSSIESALAVLRWRAGVADYLGDAFAMFPAIELDESVAIDHFLNPVDHRQLCSLCLTEFGREHNDPNAHECRLLNHVRAKWPGPPPAFRRWAAAAKQKLS
jgi:hypothetical protein